MPKPNYRHQKKQREQLKKQKKEKKRLRHAGTPTQAPSQEQALRTAPLIEDAQRERQGHDHGTALSGSSGEGGPDDR